MAHCLMARPLLRGQMRKILVSILVAIGLSLMSAAGFAADIVAKAPPPVAVTVPYSWTGFTVGPAFTSAAMSGMDGAKRITLTTPLLLALSVLFPLLILQLWLRANPTPLTA